MRPLRRVRFAEEKDNHVLTELYTQLNSCNAHPGIVDQAISKTLAVVHGEAFERVTLIAEELKDNGIFEAEATASFFVPDEKEDGLIYYAQERDHLELKARKHNYVEFGGLVSLPEKRGYCSLLTPSRALMVRWMKQTGLIDADQVLIEFLPKYQLVTHTETEFELQTNAFWEKLILPYLIQSGHLSLMLKELSCTQQGLFTKLKGLPLAERNRLIDKFFPKTIDNSLIDDEVNQVLRNVAAPTAKSTLERMYNLLTIGYFPVDGGLNCVGDISTGFTGEVDAPVDVTANASNFRDPAIVRNPNNPQVLYLTGGIWAENTAIISCNSASVIGVNEGDRIIYRRI
jgi:hypothetical protein